MQRTTALAMLLCPLKDTLRHFPLLKGTFYYERGTEYSLFLLLIFLLRLSAEKSKKKNAPFHVHSGNGSKQSHHASLNTFFTKARSKKCP